jgi:RNA ligase
MKAIQKIIALLQEGKLSSQYRNLLQITQGPEGLLLLNYTDLCQKKSLWDEVTSICRGLILNPKNGEIIAYPLPKFFNWEEYHQALPEEPFTVAEKLDGSLGILYRVGSSYRLATRGSFDSPEAKQGTALLQRLPNLSRLPSRWTLLFEILSPQQKGHVVSYSKEELALLAGIDRVSGEELTPLLLSEWATRLGCRQPLNYSFANIDEVLAQRTTLPSTQEGFVVRFAGGLRLKIKGTAYLAALKRSLGVSRARVLDSLIKGEGAYQAFLRKAPEELQPELISIGEEWKSRAAELESEACTLLAAAPNIKDRTAFLHWVSERPSHVRAALLELGNGKRPRWFRLLSEEK